MTESLQQPAPVLVPLQVFRSYDRDKYAPTKAPTGDGYLPAFEIDTNKWYVATGAYPGNWQEFSGGGSFIAGNGIEIDGDEISLDPEADVEFNDLDLTGVLNAKNANFESDSGISITSESAGVGSFGITFNHPDEIGIASVNASRLSSGNSYLNLSAPIVFVSGKLTSQPPSSFGEYNDAMVALSPSNLNVFAAGTTGDASAMTICNRGSGSGTANPNIYFARSNGTAITNNMAVRHRNNALDIRGLIGGTMTTLATVTPTSITFNSALITETIPTVDGTIYRSGADLKIHIV